MPEQESVGASDSQRVFEPPAALAAAANVKAGVYAKAGADRLAFWAAAARASAMIRPIRR